MHIAMRAFSHAGFSFKRGEEIFGAALTALQKDGELARRINAGHIHRNASTSTHTVAPAVAPVTPAVRPPVPASE